MITKGEKGHLFGTELYRRPVAFCSSNCVSQRTITISKASLIPAHKFITWNLERISKKVMFLP